MCAFDNKTFGRFIEVCGPVLDENRHLGDLIAAEAAFLAREGRAKQAHS
ncbi:hypothetical protein RGUI_0060 (plasmid) [Rhodovulum sp. P5]|nr:hypothetical protein RGUI_0060 [Rhodovulum sp. P5]